MAEKQGLGFDFIETLLESEKIDDLSDSLQADYEAILKQIKSEKDRNLTLKLKKIAKAYEHTADLICHLLNLKYELNYQSALHAEKKDK